MTMQINIGTIALFAGDYIPRGWLPCDGRKLARSGVLNGRYNLVENHLLNSALDKQPDIKKDDFNIWLPNLADVPTQTKGVKHIISLNNYSNLCGLITTIEENEAVPDKWALCDGRLLSVDAYQELYILFDIDFGGDLETTIALPEMANLGSKRYIICVEGMSPMRP
jgi:hypothetical protein